MLLFLCRYRGEPRLQVINYPLWPMKHEPRIVLPSLWLYPDVSNFLTFQFLSGFVWKWKFSEQKRLMNECTVSAIHTHSPSISMPCNVRLIVSTIQISNWLPYPRGREYKVFLLEYSLITIRVWSLILN